MNNNIIIGISKMLYIDSTAWTKHLFENLLNTDMGLHCTHTSQLNLSAQVFMINGYLVRLSLHNVGYGSFYYSTAHILSTGFEVSLSNRKDHLESL